MFCLIWGVVAARGVSWDIDSGICTQLRDQVPLTLCSSHTGWSGQGESHHHTAT